MAGLEANTSSYDQPMPVSPLDMAGKIASTRSAIQGNISNDISIDKQKLDLMNTQFGLMNKELSGMIDDPNITKEQAAARLNKFADTFKLPDVARQHMIQELQAAPDVKSFSENALRRGMDTQQKINQQYGIPGSATDQATTFQGVTSPRTGAFTPATKMPVQVPPGTPNVNNNPNDPNYLQPGVLGAAGPSGVVPAQQPTRMPVAPLNPPAARPAPVSGAIGPSVQTGFDFGQRFAGDGRGAIATGAAPGVASAIETVGKKSGEDYATDLGRAKNFQADIYPMHKVLELVKEEGPKAFGPGTPALNSIKSALVTWLPNVDQKTIDGVSNYEQAKKYLVQAARTAGNTGTNDQLAAAFEANPNVTMSGATIDTVVKSNIALRKMQHAQTLLFGKQNLPPSNYSKWISENQNVLDPRAFGFDMMEPEAKNKLIDSIATKDNSGNLIGKKGKEKEFKKFEQSLSFANDAGLIEPPGRK